jgi:hypothetical protein
MARDALDALGQSAASDTRLRCSLCQFFFTQNQVKAKEAVFSGRMGPGDEPGF